MRNRERAGLSNNFQFLERLSRDNLLPGEKKAENPLPGMEWVIITKTQTIMEDRNVAN